MQKAPTIGIIIPNRDISVLIQTLKNELPEANLRIFPNLGAEEEIDILILWKHPKGLLGEFPNLKLICSLGAGVDHITKDPSLPKGIPITRLVDEELAISMRKYILMCVLNFQKNITSIFEQNRQGTWKNDFKVEKALKVGVIGLGALGLDAAKHLRDIGFEVFGYSFSQKNIPGITCFSKEKGNLKSFLNSINVLVNLLPLTEETKGVFDLDFFKNMNPNSFFVNVGRGAHLRDDALIEAIDEGIIAEAYLDVFNQEPLPGDHPFWSYPQVILTPHIASITNQKNAGKQMAENIRRLQEKETLINLVDMEKGY